MPVGDPVNPAESPEGPVESWESPNWAVDGPVNPTGPPEGLAESWDASLVDPVNPREPPEGPPESWESSFGVGPEVPRVGSSGMCSEVVRGDGGRWAGGRTRSAGKGDPATSARKSDESGVKITAYRVQRRRWPPPGVTKV